MVARAEQTDIRKPHTLRTLIFAVALVVFAVLNPLACVWHCALQEQLAEHGQRYVWFCTAHHHDAAGNISTDGGGTGHLSGASILSAVHHGVVNAVSSLVLALLAVVLGRAYVLLRRACATIVPLPPPPKPTLRYA